MMPLTKQLEQCKQNHLYLVERYLENGCETLPEALVKAGVAKAFYIRRETIKLKHTLQAYSSMVQTCIRSCKLAKQDTSKLKGELKAIEMVRQLLGAIHKAPRAEALTPTDFQYVRHSLNTNSLRPPGDTQPKPGDD